MMIDERESTKRIKKSRLTTVNGNLIQMFE